MGASLWLSYNGNGLTSHAGYGLGVPDPYNPLNLPPYTLRCQFEPGFTPTPSELISHGCTFTQVSSSPNVWDVTKVDNPTDMSLLFSQSSYGHWLRKVLGGNTRGVTNMRMMFDGCVLLDEVSIFDSSSVTNMDYVFYGCANLRGIPLLPWTSVTTMMYAFSDSGLESFPALDTSSVESMFQAFAGCRYLSSVSSFDCSSLTDASWLFYNCYGLREATYLDLSHVTNARAMYAGCGNMTTAPATLNTSSVTDMRQMFAGCSALTRVPMLDLSSVTDMSTAFANCYMVRSGALALYNVAAARVPAIARHSGTFYECGSYTTTGQAELAQIPSDWK